MPHEGPVDAPEAERPGMVWVPGGTFLMGSDEHYPEEAPAHPVAVDGFWSVPREGVIGSAVALAYTPDEHGGMITRQAAADYLDDGPEKPVRIWNRTGRRPVLAAGNSNGDIEMLDFTQHRDKPSLRLLVLHDDVDREFDYVSGAEKALDRAHSEGWTIVSMKDDWATVF